MNLTMLSGRLTKDPELTKAGDFNKCDFTIAQTNPRTKTGMFFNITAWQKQAENLCRYMKKGNQVLVKGNIEPTNYEDKNGVKHYGMRITAKEIEFLSNSNSADESQEQEQPRGRETYEQAKQNGDRETKAIFEKQNPNGNLEEILKKNGNVASDDLPF